MGVRIYTPANRKQHSAVRTLFPAYENYCVPEEIDKSWFEGKKSVGICGATSTPKWLIENIRDFIANI